MPIAEKDIKQLWGGAGGYCSNPECRDRVAVTSAEGESYLTGEMAHIVARQAEGPRGDGTGGDNSYANLVLLCPTCHTRIDKAPENYPVEVLHQWKAQHEAWVDGWKQSANMGSTEELMTYISGLLAENGHYFERYGPRSDVAVANPTSSAYAIWTARKLDTILPNNRKIVYAIEINAQHVPVEISGVVREFKDHAQGYEQHQYERLDHYQLFPDEFRQLVEKWAPHV